MKNYIVTTLVKVFQTTRNTKMVIIFAIDLALLILSTFLSLKLAQVFPFSQNQLFYFISIVVAIRLAVFLGFGIYSVSWRFASTRQFKYIYFLIILGSLLQLIGFYFNSFNSMAVYKYLLLEFIISTWLIFSFRGGLRILRDELMVLIKSISKEKSIPILIIGAGAAGAMLASESQKNPDIKYEIKGFLDDDVQKKNQTIHNIRVLGSTRDVLKYASEFNVKEVVIAMPSASGDRIREILAYNKNEVLKFKITPGLNNIINGELSFGQLRDIKIQDLLRRNEVEEMIINESNNYIKDKVVLVTGGGGSIGSELCVQLLKFNPKTLIVFDNCEDHVYQIDRKIKELFPSFSGLICRVSDVACESDIANVFNEFDINIVFHAAAYKHVPLMQENKQSLLKNNIKGTQILLEKCKNKNINRFILISTDKAVNPTNEMGASKRFCELLTLAYAAEYNLNFSAVRFGNVLASRGSVIPLFKEQIQKGGPITVTHPNITRYFMTIPEASRLVLQAGLLATQGDIFTLDMGEPIKILDLAKDMIRLSNLSESEMKIEFTGLRPGEKMYEELSYNKEDMQKTVHTKIFVESEDLDIDIANLNLVMNKKISIIEMIKVNKIRATQKGA